MKNGFLSGANNVLIIAPHIDDEILGCGGVINKMTAEGIEVTVAVMTNGNVGDPKLFPKEGTQRGRKEALKAHEILSVKETIFYDFPTPRLDTFPAYQISNELSRLISNKNIDTVFIPHRGDIHQDHRKIYESALVACRPFESSPVVTILAYETLSETEWAAPFSDDAFVPNLFVDISKHVASKISAFDQFTEPRKKQLPHPRSLKGIESQARWRGMTISVEAAEAFMVIRSIVR